VTLVIPPLEPDYGPEWSERWHQYKQTHPRRCAACGIKAGVTLHHRRYDRLIAIPDRPGFGRSGRELDRDLTWLCSPGCHTRVHYWHDRVFPHDQRPYRWLSLVTTIYIVCVRVRAAFTPARCFVGGVILAFLSAQFVLATCALIASLLALAVFHGRRAFITTTKGAAVTRPGSHNPGG